MKEDSNPANLMEIIRTRRSVRRYDGAKVSSEVIRNTAQVLNHAPGFGGSRCWRFYLVQDKNPLSRFAAAALSGLKAKINPWLAAPGIPAFIAACADPDKSGRKGDKHFYLADTSIAMEYLVLSACENNLGTCWIGAFDEQPIRRVLGLHKHIRIVAISPLGYPFRREPSPLDLAAQYDRYGIRAMHKKRLLMEEILFLNEYGNKHNLPPVGARHASPLHESGKQSAKVILGLMQKIKFADSFTPKPVEPEKTALLIEAARLAPSASNAQPWRFILVEGKKQREALEAAAYDENGLPVPFTSAPMVIAAVAVVGFGRERGREQPYFLIDVPIAITHILLMASALGLGVNVLFDFSERRARQVLHIPERCRIVALISIGYPSRRTTKDTFPLQFFSAPPPRKPTFEIL